MFQVEFQRMVLVLAHEALLAELYLSPLNFLCISLDQWQDLKSPSRNVAGVELLAGIFLPLTSLSLLCPRPTASD